MMAFEALSHFTPPLVSQLYLSSGRFGPGAQRTGIYSRQAMMPASPSRMVLGDDSGFARCMRRVRLLRLLCGEAALVPGDASEGESAGTGTGLPAAGVDRSTALYRLEWHHECSNLRCYDERCRICSCSKHACGVGGKLVQPPPVAPYGACLVPPHPASFPQKAVRAIGPPTLVALGTLQQQQH